MNIKTKVTLIVNGIEANWYKVEAPEQHNHVRVHEEGYEVYRGLTQCLHGYELVPDRMRAHYSRLISEENESGARFTVTQQPTEEAVYGILN